MGAYLTQQFKKGLVQEIVLLLQEGIPIEDAERIYLSQQEVVFGREPQLIRQTIGYLRENGFSFDPYENTKRMNAILSRLET